MTLGDFYSTATSRGFSRDFQIRVDDIIINGESVDAMFGGPDLLNYVKSASIPSRKVEVNMVSYNTVKMPVSTGIADFGEKDNYQITFWADQGLEFRNWFFNRMEPLQKTNFSTPLTPNILGENLIQISVLDDMLQPVLSFKLEGVSIKEVGSIKYNKEGSGKPQEFSVTFAYFRLVPAQSKAIPSTAGAEPEKSLFDKFIGLTRDITQGARAITSTVQAVRGVGTATRGAVRAIRGR